MSAFERLEWMAFQLATGSGLVEPRLFTAALKALQAETMRADAQAIATFCPDHGDQATARIACHCPVADELRREATKLDPTCQHCAGDGCDPQDPGDWIPEVGKHHPGTRSPCPECDGAGLKPAS